MSKLIVIRSSEYVNLFRDYKIFVDGSEHGSLSNGASIEIDLQPGRHRIQLKIDWCSSNEVEFEVAENEIRTYKVEAAKWASLLMIYYITLGRNTFLKLSPLS